MKKYLSFLLMLAAVASFTACSEDDDNNNPICPPATYAHAAYVAGAGNYQQNNGTVGTIDYNRISDQYAYTDIYQQANHRGIGDVQDVLPMNDQVYVSCTSSSKIEILDGAGFVTTAISKPQAQFRYLATDGTNVYVSAYNGYVYKLQGNSIIDSVRVGGYPEAMSVAGGKLYVNMSDYNYDNTGSSISVINLANFTKTKELSCILNPYNQSVTDGHYVYFVSAYHSDRDGTLQRIDPATDRIDSLCEASIISYDKSSNSIVCLNTSFDENYITTPKDFFRLDLATMQKNNIQKTNLTAPTQINVDPRNGAIYVISTPSFQEPSRLYILDRDGGLIAGPIALGYSAQNVRFQYSLYK